MTLEVELWALLTFLAGLLLAFFSAAFTAARMLLAQVKEQLAAQFAAQASAQEETKAHWDSRFGALEEASRVEAGQWQRVERELMELKAELPLNYVRREDYIRGQSVIEAKLDGLALRIENGILKGVRKDD